MTQAEDVWWVIVALSVFHLCALALIFVIYQRFESLRNDTWQALIKQEQLEHQVTALQGQAVVGSRRISSLEESAQAQQLAIEQTKSQMLTGSGGALGAANELLQEGMEVQLVAQKSGLSSAEVELMRLVNSLDHKNVAESAS